MFSRKFARFVAALAFAMPLVCASQAQAQYTIVNVIPNLDSSETGQNSEPSIGVNPNNPMQAVIGAFTNGPTNPIYASTNSGMTWTHFQDNANFDKSITFSNSGTAYYAPLFPIVFTGPNPTQGTVSVYSSANPPTLPFVQNAASIYTTAPRTSIPDQPWIRATQVSGMDHIYMAFNDVSTPTANTATVRFSTDSGLTWTNTVVERNGTPAIGQDGPAIRLAVNGNTVYAAFQRWTAVADGNPDFTSNLVIVKDTTGGTGGFNALGANGTTIAAGIVDAFGTPLGVNRTSSMIALAVDPNDANRLAIAYTNKPASAGAPDHVEVKLSTDGGLTWSASSVFTTATNSGLPSIAIASNGTIGLLYQALVNGQDQLHFVQSTDSFATNTDQLIFGWQDGSPPVNGFQPYTGDFYDLTAVDGTFYGTFSATNDLRTAALPFGVTLQRNFVGTPGTGTFALRDLANLPVGFSIDPYYFSTAALIPGAVPEPSTLSLVAVGLGLIWWRRRLRK
jgi:hypothetical protein